MAEGPGTTDAFRAARQIVRRFLRFMPSSSYNVGTRQNYATLREMLEARTRAMGTPVRVLVVGGGSIGVGAEVVVEEPTFEVVETDVHVGPRTLVVCDAHDLPFADGKFDAVICQAVLEHVIDPARVAGEIWRVLKPEGYVYSEIPFMQQVHLGAFDFTRFTHVGHRRLWRRFDEVRSGAQGGPGMALIWSLTYFWRAFLPSRLWPIVDRVVSFAVFLA